MPAADSTPPVRPLPGWVLAALSAMAGVLLARTPPILADPSPCPGLSELVALGVFRALPATPAGTVLPALHGAGAVLALVAFWRLSASASRRSSIATSVTLGVAFTSAFVWRLAPTLTLAFAAACVAVLMLARASRLKDPIRRRVNRRATLALAVTAACLPPLTLGLAGLAGWRAWRDRRDAPGRRRGLAVLANAGVVLALPAAVIWLLPAAPATLPTPAGGSLDCLVPLSPSIGTVTTGALRSISRAGLLVLALALLGMFGARRWLPDRSMLVALAVLPAAAAVLARARVPGVLIPTVVVIWTLAAMGLRELSSGASRRTLIVGALVTVLLPVQQIARWAFLDPDERLVPSGQSQFTAASFERLVAALPPHAALVEDDAVASLLTRHATASWRRTGKTPLRVERRIEDVRAALATARVFAHPRAQRTLPHQGFRLTADLRPPIPGLAEVRAGRPCVTLSSDWVAAESLQGADRLAVVARDAESRGPVTIYVGAETPFRPSPIDWPEPAVRGFDVTLFDRTNARGRRRLDSQRQLDGLGADRTALSYPYVLRLELWRIPGAPLTLPVELGAATSAALARPIDPTPNPGLLLCPSLPFEPAAVK